MSPSFGTRRHAVWQERACVSQGHSASVFFHTESRGSGSSETFIISKQKTWYYIPGSSFPHSHNPINFKSCKVILALKTAIGNNVCEELHLHSPIRFDGAMLKLKMGRTSHLPSIIIIIIIIIPDLPNTESRSYRKQPHFGKYQCQSTKHLALDITLFVP